MKASLMYLVVETQLLVHCIPSAKKISHHRLSSSLTKYLNEPLTSRSSLSKSMSSTHGLMLLKINLLLFRRFPSDFCQIWNFFQKRNYVAENILSFLSIKAIDYISLIVNSNHLFRLMIIVFFLVIFIISMQQLKTVALITTHTRSVNHFFQKIFASPSSIMILKTCDFECPEIFSRSNASETL